MLTIFTTAKPFLGHSAIIQRNALQSWKRLHPDVEIILFGDDEGAAEVAREFGLRHEVQADRHPSGLKYIHYMFDRAQEIARHEILCYINCDILLSADFCEALQIVRGEYDKFLMVGRRWDVEIAAPIDFHNPGWSDDIRQLARDTNDQKDGWWIDYFCFTRNLYYKQTPAFVIGRVRWDNWLVWKALDSHVPVVDVSSRVVAVHQNHGYSYHPNGRQGVWNDEHSRRNLALAGGWWHQCKICDASDRLDKSGNVHHRPLYCRWGARHWRAAQLRYGPIARAFTYNVWLPVWHFALNLTRPLRARLGLRSGSPKDSSGAETLR